MPSWGKGVKAYGEPSCLCLHYQSLYGREHRPFPGNNIGQLIQNQRHRQPGLLDSTVCGPQAQQGKRKSGTHKRQAKQEIRGNYFWNVNKAFCYFHYCRSKDAIIRGRCLIFRHRRVRSQWREMVFHIWVANSSRVNQVAFQWSRHPLVLPSQSGDHRGKLFKS